MNPISEFFTAFSKVFSMVQEVFPWFFPLTFACIAFCLASTAIEIFFSTPPPDPQDYGDTPQYISRLANHPQYDPEHWYTGKD